MATANAILLKQRIEQSERDAHKRAQSEHLSKVWKQKTRVLAVRANLRYEQAGMAAETAERKIEENIKKNRQYVLERKGKGVAALLS